MADADTDTRPWMVFTTQAAANVAVTSVANKAFQVRGNVASTIWPDPVVELSGENPKRWALKFPTDLAWMAGVDATTFQEVPAGDVGLAVVGGTSTGLVSTISAPLALRDKFTSAEVEAITCAATKEMVVSNYTSGKLQVLMDTLDAAATLGLDTARVQMGFGFLVQGGLLTAARANAILAPVGVLPQSAWK